MAIRIEKINDSLEGEFRFRGKARSFPFTLPGDSVQFRTVRDGRGFRTITEKIERAEKYELPFEPVSPACRYYGECGGCRGQHIPYEHQFQIKISRISEKLRERGIPEPEFLPADNVYRYRNRMDFVTERSDTGRIFIGLRGAGDFSKFVDIEECLIQKLEADIILRTCRDAVSGFPELVFSRSENTGILKYITIRWGTGSGAVILTFNPRSLWKEKETAIYKEFIQNISEKISSIRIDSEDQPPLKISLTECYTDSAESEVSNTSDRNPLTGTDSFREEILGIPFEVPGDAFFQPNPRGFEKLISRSLEWLMEIYSPEESGHLLDLYCGAGVLSSVLFKKLKDKNILFKQISGIDFTESAVRRAPLHFQDIPEERLNFQAADLIKPPENFINSLYSLIIMDPPRAGLSGPVKKALNRLKPAPWILYFSCNPKSQVADLTDLEQSYEPVKSLLTDPYPHTPHQEQVVLLRRRT